MDVRANLSGKKEQAELLLAYNRGRHSLTVPDWVF